MQRGSFLNVLMTSSVPSFHAHKMMHPFSQETTSWWKEIQ
jgi:hypothetical protein